MINQICIMLFIGIFFYALSGSWKPKFPEIRKLDYRSSVNYLICWWNLLKLIAQRQCYVNWLKHNIYMYIHFFACWCGYSRCLYCTALFYNPILIYSRDLWGFNAFNLNCFIFAYLGSTFGGGVFWGEQRSGSRSPMYPSI